MSLCLSIAKLFFFCLPNQVMETLKPVFALLYFIIGRWFDSITNVDGKMPEISFHLPK